MLLFSCLKQIIKALINPNQSKLRDKFEPLVARVEENASILHNDKYLEEQSLLNTQNDDHTVKSKDEPRQVKDRKVHIKILLEYMTTEERNRFYYLNSPGWSVTGRVKKTKQRRGGYVSPRSMKKTFLGQNKNEGLDGLNPDENIAANLIGLAVDYLTRVMIGEDAINAFKVSLLGASIINEDNKAQQLISKVNGLNKEAVISAVKLSGYDVIYRFSVLGYKPVDTINPNEATVENIITMVNRSLKFFERYGPVVISGFDLEGGYTEIISNGDGDYLTSDMGIGLIRKKRIPVVFDDEAKIVKEIFDDYLSNLSIYQIARKLNDAGIPSPKGSKWMPGNIRRTLININYTWNMLFGKFYSDGPLTQNHVPNRGERPKYYAEETHEAIIDMETFNKVQELLKKNSKNGAYRSGTMNCFSKKIICELCGKPFGRSSLKMKKGAIYVAWICKKRTRDISKCPVVTILEEDLKEIAINLLNLNGFSNEAFSEKVDHITVSEDDYLHFYLKDGQILTHHYPRRRKLLARGKNNG